MERRIVVADELFFPPDFGFGVGFDKFYVRLETSFFGVVACVLTAYDAYNDDIGTQTAWLCWSDGVADWCREYPSLSSAVASLGLLVAYGEDGWGSGFGLESADFANLWHRTVVPSSS